MRSWLGWVAGQGRLLRETLGWLMKDKEEFGLARPLGEGKIIFPIKGEACPKAQEGSFIQGRRHLNESVWVT